MHRYLRISWGALKIALPVSHPRYTDAIDLGWGLGLIFLKKKKIPDDSSMHLALKLIVFQVFLGLLISHGHVQLVIEWLCHLEQDSMAQGGFSWYI